MPSGNMMIREAQPGDDAWIAARHGAIYAAEFGFDESFETYVVDKIRGVRAKDDPFTRFWIAEMDGKPAGCIAVSSDAEGRAFLNFVLVDPAARRGGVAQLLMQTAINHARSSGFSTVRLETYDCLVGARKLYARLGFSIVATEADVVAYGQTFSREFWELQLTA